MAFTSLNYRFRGSDDSHCNEFQTKFVRGCFILDFWKEHIDKENREDKQEEKCAQTYLCA